MTKVRWKRVACRVIQMAGGIGLLDFAQDWLTLQVTPHLLDERVLPNRAMPRTLRGLKTRALCNPHSPFHRSLFWLGRLHERELDDFLRAFLRPGDHFVDIGANFGQVSALAAALVGRHGSVTAFEPHPDLAQLIRDHLRAEVGDVVRVRTEADRKSV